MYDTTPFSVPGSRIIKHAVKTALAQLKYNANVCHRLFSVYYILTLTAVTGETDTTSAIERAELLPNERTDVQAAAILELPGHSELTQEKQSASCSFAVQESAVHCSCDGLQEGCTAEGHGEREETGPRSTADSSIQVDNATEEKQVSAHLIYDDDDGVQSSPQLVRY